jgi:hypothetical protein
MVMAEWQTISATCRIPVPCVYPRVLAAATPPSSRLACFPAQHAVQHITMSPTRPCQGVTQDHLSLCLRLLALVLARALPFSYLLQARRATWQCVALAGGRVSCCPLRSRCNKCGLCGCVFWASCVSVSDLLFCSPACLTRDSFYLSDQAASLFPLVFKRIKLDR